MALAEIINLTPVNMGYNTEFTFQIKVNNAPTAQFEMINTLYSRDSRVTISRVKTSPYIYITNGISNTITAKAEAQYPFTGPLDFITAFQITLQNSPGSKNYQHPNFVNQWFSEYFYVLPAGVSSPTLTIDSYQPEVEENQTTNFIFKSNIPLPDVIFNYNIEGFDSNITVSDFNKTTLTGLELKSNYSSGSSLDLTEENKYLFTARINHNLDTLAENTELYRLVVYSQQFGVLVTTPYVSIFNVSPIAFTNAPVQLEEGVTTTLTIRFLVPPPNYLYSWQARFVADPGNPLASAEDFVYGISGGPNEVITRWVDGLPIYLGEFTLTPKYDSLLEQPFEYFTVDIKDNTNTVIFTKIFKIGDANNPASISATLTPSTTVIDNTLISTCQFAVNTLSIDPSGTLYWKIINNTSQDSNFKATTGTIVLQNKVGAFQVEINPEINPGSAVTKTFSVGVYFDPQTTQLIGTSQPIQIIFNPIKYGILIKDKNKKVVYSSNDVTWNQVDYFFAQADTTTTKTYPALIGKDSRGVQALINAPAKERESTAHTIAINPLTGQVTVSGGNEQAYILVLTR